MDRIVKGILGRKLGMTQVVDDADNRPGPGHGRRGWAATSSRTSRPLTLTATPPFSSASGAIDPRKVNKPESGHFAARGVPASSPRGRGPHDRRGAFDLGQEVAAETFVDGHVVDVVGTTKGKGYAGVMKRHGFHGVSASHGSHRNHRKPGSIGACATPGRVFKGVRMAGRMGHVRHTTLNLKLHAVDADKGLLLIKGAVPGPDGGLVLVRTAAKVPTKKGAI